ncbi:MAG: SUMF1/EgtB/PvdO family nonheme iron enzyme [Candidatus Methylumidiphilus sp.]
MATDPAPVKVFYSYAHTDERYKKKLETCLSAIQREGLIEPWDDRKIMAGQLWAGEIKQSLESADLILLLISPDFIASNYCHEIEMKLALERHEQGLAEVVPIIIRHADWQHSPFAKFQSLPKDSKPVQAWKPQDLAFLDIAEGLRKHIGGLQQKKLNPSGGSVPKHKVPATARSDADAESAYRAWLVKRCEKISLSGLDIDADDARSRATKTLGLEQVYVDMDTETTAPESGINDALAAGLPLKHLPRSDQSRQDKTRPVAAWEAGVLFSRLVLLGVPGSGKTTFVNRLCIAMARRDWGAFSGLPQNLRQLPPVLVVLRDFAHWLAVSKNTTVQGLREASASASGADPAEVEANRRKLAERQGADVLRAYLDDELDKAGLADCKRYLFSVLDVGPQVFFDGLDETPPEQRPLVLGCIQGFATAYPRCRLLVTCRVASYQRQEWRLPDGDFPEFTLAEFSDGKIDLFINAWYGELARSHDDPPETTRRSVAKLQEALHRKDLARLKRNPLLLTVIALVHTHKRELPDHRAQLYKECVEILLWEWEKRKPGAGEPVLARLMREAGLSRAHLLRVLRELAFKVHEEVGAETEHAADIGEAALVGAFALLRGPHTNSAAYKWAKEAVDALGERSGLLVERRPGVFAFPHRTFQEYLAGLQLTEGNFVSKAAELAGVGDYWREVILLAVGHLVHNEAKDELPAFLADKLCPVTEPADDTGWRKIHLAADVLLEMGLANVERAVGGKSRVDRVRGRLVALLERGHLNPIERAAAGDTLGTLGDPRFDPGLCHLPCLYRGEAEPLFGFVEIAPGPFWMGSEKGDKDARDNEFGNKNPLTIPYPYRIARYPVTVAQFGAFIEDGGYADAAFWKNDAAWRWLKSETRTGPADWDGQRLHPNRPVSSVTWYESMAYCAWLETKLQAMGRMPQGHVIRLPSEAEWEKAARWRSGEAPSPLRYPWGNGDWSPDRANISESGISHPTPVGMYPEGATDSGLYDMAGNVFEWTVTGFGDYPYDSKRNGEQGNGLVVRGGSWDYNSYRARCAFRDWGNPGYYWFIIGFRVVLSLANAGF